MILKAPSGADQTFSTFYQVDAFRGDDADIDSEHCNDPLLEERFPDRSYPKQTESSESMMASGHTGWNPRPDPCASETSGEEWEMVVAGLLLRRRR